MSNDDRNDSNGRNDDDEPRQPLSSSTAFAVFVLMTATSADGGTWHGVLLEWLIRELLTRH